MVTAARARSNLSRVDAGLLDLYGEVDRVDSDETLVVRAGRPVPEQGRPFLPGPTFASAYHLSDDPAGVAFVYGRYHNPTWSAYETAVGALDGGTALVFASGMAAASATLTLLLRPGRTLVLPSDCYYTTRLFASNYLTEIGVDVLSAPTASSELRELAGRADLLWLESPSNPHLDICDIEELSSVAHERGGTVVVDNSTATAFGQRPLALGADVVVSADTKATTGHGDLVLGHVTARDPELALRMASWRTLTGGVPGPHEVWLAHRSLATLAVRCERQCDNAFAIALLLQAHPAVRSVRYPGLAEHPAHALARRQMRRFGGVVSFELADAEAAQRFLTGCRLVDEATSFGGVGSTAERRGRWGGDDVAPGFIRFSAGIEATEDLLSDIEGSLARLVE
jgi:cystathionine gamma-lyase